MPNRSTISLFLVAFTATAAGPASQPTVQPAPIPATRMSSIPMADFRSNQCGFHLKYPREWRLIDPPVNNQVMSLQTVPTQPGASAFGVVGLRIQDGPKEARDPQLLKDISGEMVDYTFNHGGKKITVKPDKLGDLAARRIAFDIEKPEGSTRVICILAVRRQREYVFNIAAPKDQIEQMLPGIEEMLKSFEIDD